MQDTAYATVLKGLGYQEIKQNVLFLLSDPDIYGLEIRISERIDTEQSGYLIVKEPALAVDVMLPVSLQEAFRSYIHTIEDIAGDSVARLTPELEIADHYRRESSELRRKFLLPMMTTKGLGEPYGPWQIEGIDEDNFGLGILSLHFESLTTAWRSYLVTPEEFRAFVGYITDNVRQHVPNAVDYLNRMTAKERDHFSQK